MQQPSSWRLPAMKSRNSRIDLTNLEPIRINLLPRFLSYHVLS